MLDSPVIDVVLGLILMYFVLALVCSAVQEWFATLFGLRAKNLRQGIENLIGGDLAEQLYKHSLITSLGRPKHLPSYISAKTFSTVLLDLLAKDKAGKPYTDLTADELRQMINQMPKDNPVRGILDSLVDTAQGKVDALQRELAHHFDDAMTRVGGWYKRTVTYWLFGIAGVITIATNASTVHVATTLWKNDALRAGLAAQAQAMADGGSAPALDQAIGQLSTLPVGWHAESIPAGFEAWAAALLGWALTTAAISLGAPFWFDLMGRVARLRGTGNRPEPQSGQRN